MLPCFAISTQSQRFVFCRTVSKSEIFHVILSHPRRQDYAGLAVQGGPQLASKPI